MSEFGSFINDCFYNLKQKNKSDKQIAEELVNHSALLFPDKQGKTLLHYIADDFFDFKNELRLELITLLFERQADANAVDQDGRTTLHLLVAKWQDTLCSFAEKFDQIAELFFENGAQYTLRDKNQKTPLDVLLENPNHSPLVVKVLIKFMLLAQPSLPKPDCISNHENGTLYSDSWNIYKTNIDKLQLQKISDTDFTLYHICSSKNLASLTKPLYRYHEQLKEFRSASYQNNFHEYSDKLQNNLEKLQQNIIRIKITNEAVNDSINFLYSKNEVLLNEDVIRKIFTYLTTKEVSALHIASNPKAFFKYNPQLSKETDIKNKPTLSCCCIS